MKNNKVDKKAFTSDELIIKKVKLLTIIMNIVNLILNIFWKFNI